MKATTKTVVTTLNGKSTYASIRKTVRDLEGCDVEKAEKMLAECGVKKPTKKVKIHNSGINDWLVEKPRTEAQLLAYIRKNAVKSAEIYFANNDAMPKMANELVERFGEKLPVETAVKHAKDRDALDAIWAEML